MNVTLIDSTEEMITEDLSEIEMEIRSSTAQFEEWVLGFFDRIFVIVTLFFKKISFIESKKNEKKKKKIPSLKTCQKKKGKIMSSILKMV